METKNSKMFEKFIKDSFDNFEVTYESKDWNAFEKKFDKALKKQFFNKLKLFSFMGSAIIIGILAIYTFNNSNKTSESFAINNHSLSPNITATHNITHTAENITETTNNNTTKIISEQTKKPSTKIPTQEPRTNNTEIIKNNKTTESDIKEENIDLKNTNNNTETIIENSNKILNLSIDANKLIVCLGEEIAFYPSVKGNNYQYKWHFGDENLSTSTNPIHTYNKPGNFNISLSLTDINTNIVYNATTSVLVNKTPESNFDYEITQEGLAYPQVKFFDKSQDALHWEWHFGDGKISYEQNPLHVYFLSNDKDINVTLSTTNVFGCQNKTEKNLTFSNVFDIMAPNAFSPDGDGLNDYFLPKALEIYDIPFEMFIYDRAGTLIFNTKSKSYPWDGRIAQSGIIPESGTFIWIVIMKNKNGNDVKYGGTVSIIK